MADVKIDDLVSAGAVVAAMQLETDLGGVTANKIDVTQLITFFDANLNFASISIVNQTKTLQVYTDPADFTAGVTIALTLPVDAVVEDNLEVYFNGLFQESTEWTITTGGAPSVDFSSAIPVGITRVEVRVFS